MKTVLKSIDAIINNVGKISAFLAVILISLISLEIILLKVFTAPASWSFETILMVAGVFYAIGWSYAQNKRAHIRVDVIYSRFKPRVKAAIDVIGSLLCFFPLISLFAYIAVVRTVQAFERHEVSNLSYWYPILWPFRAVIAIAFIILFLQGLAQFIQDFYFLVRNKSYD
jgi:TRAP-type mannitol/chloroaromatic compound transport system permease small subunit